MFISVPVASVTLAPSLIIALDGQQINMTCTTSYCNPPANITWYMSSTDFTSQSNSATVTYDGLVRTMSALSINASKSDNGKQVFCTVGNIPGQRVNSTVNVVTVLCMYHHIL